MTQGPRLHQAAHHQRRGSPRRSDGDREGRLPSAILGPDLGPTIAEFTYEGRVPRPRSEVDRRIPVAVREVRFGTCFKEEDGGWQVA